MEDSSDNSFHIIPSPIADGYILNLVRIVEDIGYDSGSLFLRETPSRTQAPSIGALLKIVIEMGGAYGPLTGIWRSSSNKTYFQRWYLDRRQRSASLPDHLPVNDVRRLTTQKTTAHDQLTPLVKMSENSEEKRLRDQIQRIYGFDDTETETETETTVSSRRSSIDEGDPTAPVAPPISPIILRPVMNESTRPWITVREYHSGADRKALLVDRSTSEASFSSARTQEENNHQAMNQYEEILRQHPDLYNDPNPTVITEPNPNPVTYRQNVMVRYLVPPTPPVPGPLIIRGSFKGLLLRAHQLLTIKD